MAAALGSSSNSIRRAAHSWRPAIEHVGVDHRRRNVLVGRQLLDVRRAILPLGAATVAGSMAGNLGVQREGWAEFERTILGEVLRVLAMRCAYDVVRRAASNRTDGNTLRR